MDISLTDCILENFGPPRFRDRRGGPITLDGKEKTSQNLGQPGCRSKEKILPGEKLADYDALWEQWLEHYEPESAGDLQQLEQVVDGAWRLRRAERAYTRVERALHQISCDAVQWPPDLLAQLQRMQSYRTTADNWFQKALRTLEFLKARRDSEQRHHDRKAEAKRAERARQIERATPAQAEALRAYDAELEAYLAAKAPLSPAQQLFQGQNAVQKRNQPVLLEQSVEIRIENGQTTTELFPSNEDLIERGKAMLPPPELVLRHLNFPEGIPAEYDWIGVRDAEQRKRGCSGMQRMTADEWLELIQREATEADGHLLPAPNSPHREKRDLCDCPLCVTKVELLRRKIEESRKYPKPGQG